MATEVTDILLDINHTRPRLRAVRGDRGSRRLCFRLIDSDNTNESVINLENHLVTLYISKPNGKKVNLLCSVTAAERGECEVRLSAAACSVAGESECEITVWGADGSVLTSRRFVLEVEESLRDESAVTESDEFSALTDALSSCAQGGRAWSEETALTLSAPASEVVLASDASKLSELMLLVSYLPGNNGAQGAQLSAAGMTAAIPALGGDTPAQGVILARLTPSLTVLSGFGGTCLTAGSSGGGQALTLSLASGSFGAGSSFRLWTR